MSLSLVDQFSVKHLFSIFGVIAFLHVLAFVVQHNVMSVVVLGVFGIFMAILAWYRMDWALAVAFLEVIVGGHGHLFSLVDFGYPISMRMVIFLAIMVIWFVRYVAKKDEIRFIAQRDVPFALLGFAVFVGIVNGLVQENSLSALVDDANSFIILGYLLPFSTLIWNQQTRKLFLSTFFVGALWMSIFTIGLLYAFSHLDANGIWTLYTFVRDARLFEVTLLSSPAEIVSTLYNGQWYFRVFSQGQFYVVAYWLLFLAATWMIRKHAQDHHPRSIWLWHVFLLAALVASLSRSFWVALVPGILVVFIGAIWDRVRPFTLVKRALVLIPCAFASIAILWLAITFPVPARPDLYSSPFYKGESDDTRELAVSSRWNLLPPMMTEIRESPFVGSGFGEEVTFISDDPRVRAINPSGEWTAYRFEWGFLDIWLKMGVLGLLSFGWILFIFLQNAIAALRTKREDTWLSVGLCAGVIMLYAAHMFSPYLNHPIGLFFLVVVAMLLRWKRHEKELDEQPVRASLSSVAALYQKAPVLQAKK